MPPLGIPYDGSSCSKHVRLKPVEGVPRRCGSGVETGGQEGFALSRTRCRKAFPRCHCWMLGGTVCFTVRIEDSVGRLADRVYGSGLQDIAQGVA